MKNAGLGGNACHSELPKSGGLHIEPRQQDRRLWIVRPAQVLTAASIIALGVALNAATPKPAFADPGTCLLDADNNDVATAAGDGVGGSTAAAVTQLACGNAASATGADSVALGDTTSAAGPSSIAIGADSTVVAGATSSIAIGDDANVSNASTGAIAIGDRANVGFGVISNQGIAIGVFADVGRNFGALNGIAIGNQADVDEQDGIAMGNLADVANGATAGVAIGESADAIGENAIAIGEDAQGGDAAADRGAIAIGNDGDGDGLGARALSAGAVAIGEDALAQNSTAVGAGAAATGLRSTALGEATATAGADSVAVGVNASAGFSNSAAFGAGAVATSANQQVFGTASNTYTMPGITSSGSRSAQSGPLELVTSDATGNLATDGGKLFDTVESNTEGVAIAMALSDPILRGTQRVGFRVNLGAFAGEYGLGFTGIGVVDRNILGTGMELAFGGGVGFGVRRGEVGGRVGAQLAW